jgi:hypothetical protein
LKNPRNDAMSLNIERLANVQPVYAGVTPDVPARPPTNQHGGSDNSKNDSTTTEAPKCFNRWKQHHIPAVRNAVERIIRGEDEDSINEILKEATGLSIYHLYIDKEYMSWYFDVTFPNRKPKSITLLKI